MGERPRGGLEANGARSIIEASSLIAASVYAYGWITIGSMLGRFDVGPEEVGVGFSYLTVRAAFPVLILAAAVALTFLAVTYASNRFGDASFDPRVLVFVVPITLLTFASYAIADGSDDFFSFGLAPALLPLVFAAASRYLDHMKMERRYILSIPIRKILVPFKWLMAGLGLFMILAGPFLLGGEFADRIERGAEVTPPLLPGVPGLTVRSVAVRSITDEGKLLTESRCVLYFGSAGGVSVFYDAGSDTVERLPDEQIAVTSPCP